MPIGYEPSIHGYGQFNPISADQHRERCEDCRRDLDHLIRCCVLTPEELVEYRRVLQQRRSMDRWGQERTEPSSHPHTGLEFLLAGLFLIGYLFYKAAETLSEEYQKAQATKARRQEKLRAQAPRFYDYLWHPAWSRSTSECDRAAILFLRATEVAHSRRLNESGSVHTSPVLSVSALRIIAEIRGVMEWPPSFTEPVLTRLTQVGAIRLPRRRTEIELRYGFYNQIPRGDGSTPSRAARLFAPYFTKRLGGFGSILHPSIPDVVPLRTETGLIRVDELWWILREEMPHLLKRHDPTSVRLEDDIYIGSGTVWKHVLKERRLIHVTAARLLQAQHRRLVHVQELEMELERRGYTTRFSEIVEVLTTLHEAGCIRYDPAGLVFTVV